MRGVPLSLAMLIGGCGPDDAPPREAAQQVAVDPKSAAEALTEARTLLGNDKGADPPKALARLEATFGSRPSDPEAAALLARAAFRSEQPERCRVALDAYFAHEPKDRADWSAEAWVLRGWLLEREGKSSEALPHYDRALQISPVYAFAMLRKGSALAQDGKVDDAIGWIEKAIERRPGMVEAHFVLAQLYRRAGRAADADREARIHRLLNQTTDNTANTPDSVMEKFAAYDELERLLPQWVEGRLTLVQMEWRGGLRDQAVTRLKRLVAEHPESSEAKTLLAQIERGAPGDGRR